MVGKEIRIRGRNGEERTHLTYGGLSRSGGEHCDYNCGECKDILC